MGCLTAVVTPIIPSIELGIEKDASDVKVTSISPRIALAADRDGGFLPVATLVDNNLSLATSCTTDMRVVSLSLVNGINVSCNPICRLNLVSFSYDFNLDFMS